MSNVVHLSDRKGCQCGACKWQRKIEPLIAEMTLSVQTEEECAEFCAGLMRVTMAVHRETGMRLGTALEGAVLGWKTAESTEADNEPV